MDLLKALDSSYSKASTQRIIGWIGKSPARFGELVFHTLKGSSRIQIRAAWPLSYCVEAYPHLVKPHLKVLVRALRQEGLHDAVKRSIVRLLQYAEIPRPLQGEVASHCFGFLADPGVPPAIRIFSMTVLENLAAQNQDLKSELRIVLEDHLPYGSSGFVNQGRKVLKRMSQ